MVSQLGLCIFGVFFQNAENGGVFGRVFLRRFSEQC